MKTKKPIFEYTINSLTLYQQAALENADLLVQEAQLLIKNNFFARGYFLSVAAIEEVGKAATTFHGRGRNLSNPDVQRRLRLDLQNHSAKITAAFIGLFLEMSTRGQFDRFEHLINHMIDLKRGREPAMYSELYQTGKVGVPSQLVRPRAAIDCQKLASECLVATKSMVKETQPAKSSATLDALYVLGDKSHKVWSDEKFGGHLLSTFENEGLSIENMAAAVLNFNKND